LFLIFVVLVVMSQFVLSVSVEGNKRVSDDVILNEAEKFGINRWAFKDNLDLNVIGKELPKNIPDIVWSALEARGTNINIKVVEKTLPEKNVGSGDLVAAKAGLVQEIMVIEGQALIHEGETVKAGQVVIKAGGGLKEYSFGNSSEGKEIVVTNPSAKGFVRGRVWYSAESKVLLEEDITEESGAETIGWGIKIKDRVIMITNELCPYESAINKTNSYNLPSWRNWRFPVEIIKVKYRQTLVHHVKRTIDEAQRLAESLAREEMEALIPPDVKVLKDKIRIIESGKGVEHVRVEAETYEELAVYVQ
ncbi:MAG: sporulation protein YqfD, partial [Eubacteriales bacterium]